MDANFAGIIKAFQAAGYGLPGESYDSNFGGILRVILNLPMSSKPPYDNSWSGILAALQSVGLGDGRVYDKSISGVVRVIQELSQSQQTAYDYNYSGWIKSIQNSSTPVPTYNPPTNLVVTPSGSSGNWTVNVSWTPPVGGSPDDYTVQISTNESNWSNTQTVVSPAASYTGIPNGTYYFRVRANYPTGVSSWLQTSPGSGLVLAGESPPVNPTLNTDFSTEDSIVTVLFI